MNPNIAPDTPLRGRLTSLLDDADARTGWKESA